MGNTLIEKKNNLTYILYYLPLNKSDLTTNLSETLFAGKYGASIDNNIYYVSAHTWDTFITTISHINGIGNIIYTSYPILLLITSIILLLSMIGSIIITVRR